MAHHLIEYDEQCRKCKGTGIYVDYAGQDRVGVVCQYCDGTGCHHVKYEYDDFELLLALLLLSGDGNYLAAPVNVATESRQRKGGEMSWIHHCAVKGESIGCRVGVGEADYLADDVCEEMECPWCGELLGERSVVSGNAIRKVKE